MQLSNKHLSLFALLLAIALSLWIFEEFLPRPIPWLKLGFSYIAVLVTAETISISHATLLAFARIFLGALLLGRLFSPAFILSFAGTSAAMLTILLLWRLKGKLLSIIGISIAAASAHVFAQLLCAALLFYRLDAMTYLFLPSGLWSIFSGAVVGYCAVKVSAVLSKVFRADSVSPDFANSK